MAEPKDTGSYYSPGGLRLWGSATLGGVANEGK